MNQTMNTTKGLSIKDMVVTGIFTALLLVAVFIGAIPFAPNPLLTFYMPLGGALLGGPIFLLRSAKVPKRWVMTISGVIIGLIMFATGMHWAMDFGYMLGGLIGDLIAGTKKYRSVKLNIIAYACFCLGATGSYIAYFANPAAWNSLMLNGGTTQSYLDTMSNSVHGWTLPVILIGTVLVAVLSGFVGSKMLKKQFEKAGITV